MNNIFPWNWAFHLKCFAVLSVHLKSWVNLLYSGELSPVYIMQGSFHQVLKCKTFCGKRENAVLWLQLWPEGHTLSKYDFTQIVRARAALKKTRRLALGRQVSSVFSLFSSWLCDHTTHIIRSSACPKQSIPLWHFNKSESSWTLFPCLYQTFQTFCMIIRLKSGKTFKALICSIVSEYRELLVNTA